MRFTLSARPRCGCRDSMSGRHLGASCPRLTNGRHGNWTWQVRGRELQDLVPAGKLRGGGHATKREALAQGDEVRRLLDVVAVGDTDALWQVADMLITLLGRQEPLPTADELSRRYAAGGILNRTVTVGEFLREWLTSRKKLKRSTRRAYESHISVHLIPHLGRIPIGRLRTCHVAAMFAAIESNNSIIEGDNDARRAVATALSEARRRRDRPAAARYEQQLGAMPPYRRQTGPSSIHRIRATLRKALNDARRKDGLIATNPAADVELAPPGMTKPMVWTSERVARWRRTGEIPAPVMVWTPQQTAAFLAYARNHRLYALYHLIAHRGLRRGEAVGLPWTDTDLASGMLTIREQRVQVGWEVEVSRPKSDAGERAVALDPGTVEALRSHRRRQRRERLAWGQAWLDSGLVFTREDGSPLHPETVSEVFRKLVVGANLPPVRLHDLRHGAATMALAAGVDIKVVQELLGHSTSQLTRDTYTSVLPELQRSAADAIAALINNAQAAGPAGKPSSAGPTMGSHGPTWQDRDSPIDAETAGQNVIPLWGGRDLNPRPMDYESTALTG